MDVASCGSGGGFVNIIREERRHCNHLENKIEEELNNEEPRVEATSIRENGCQEGCDEARENKGYLPTPFIQNYSKQQLEGEDSD